MGMALFDRLTEGGGDADGQVAGDLLGADAFGGKGEHVRCLVLVAKLTIEAADGGVGGELHGDFALEANGGLGILEEARQGACGRAAEVAGSWREFGRSGRRRRG
jgi:hypothetical protein